MSRRAKPKTENRLNGEATVPAPEWELLAVNLPPKPSPLPQPMALLKLDLGCGPNKQPGYVGVDSIAFPGVDAVVNLGTEPWPWADNSVAEVYSSHFLEHLTQRERVHVANELYRVLVPGKYVNGQLAEGFARIVTPHWCSERAYGDPTHQWPAVTGWMYFYWNRDWRMGNPSNPAFPAANAPHADIAHNPDGYDCDFDWNLQGIFRPELLTRSEEYRRYASENYKEVFTDLVAIMTSKKVV